MRSSKITCHRAHRTVTESVKAIVVLMSTLAFFSCGTSFEQIRGVTRIEIRDNQNRSLRTITEPLQVNQVMQFINARSTQWKVPWAGVPVPTLIADYYQGTEFAGHFGAGANFFECQRAGGFYSRLASEEELQAFETLVGAKRKTTSSRP